MADKTVRYTKCLGIWNRVEPEMIKQPNPEDSSYALFRAENVDIDDVGDVGRCSGYSIVSAGEAHSIWSDKAKKRAFFIRDGSMYLFLGPGRETLIATGLGNYFMSFAEVDGLIYFSNRSVIGYIDSDNVVHPIGEPTEEMKSAIPPAEFLEVYKGSLYGLIDDVLWYSDAGKYQQFDPKNNVRRLEGIGTLLRATDDGLYVGTTDAVTFAAGDDPAAFVLRQVSQFGAIPGSACEAEGFAVTAKGLGPGKFIMWTGVESMCIGGPSGQVFKLAHYQYALPSGKSRGASLFRLNGTFRQYITTLK